MKAGWKKEKLGEACELLARGIAPKYIENGGIRVVNQKCIRNHRIDFSLARRNDLTLKKVPAERRLRLGDVLVNSTGTGTLGRVAQVRDNPDEPTTVDTHVSIVRPKAGSFFPDFFGYMLVNIEDELIAGGLGASGQTELPRTDLEAKFDVSYPTSLEEQQRIVAVLDEAFEGLDRARANAEANLQNARELFESIKADVLAYTGPNREEVILSDVADISSGLVDPREDAFADMLHLGAGNMITGTDELVDVKTARKEKLKSGKYLFDETTVLYSKIRPYLRKAARPGFQGLCSADVYPLAPKPEKLDRNFLFHLLLGNDFTEYAISGSDRAGMPKVNRKHMFAYRFELPPLDAQRRIATVIDEAHISCSAVVELFSRKLQDLDDLRQSLLQKAFAGELT